MPDTTIDPLFLSFQEAVAGRYSLERELGRGGMGVVYLAREVRLDRLVAIKLLPPELAAIPALRDRFLREARTAARLSHPYIVPIHAVDEIGGFVFFVMAFVDGETLAQRVASRGPLNSGDGARIVREVAWALAYAHAQGVVHRDVKPANILLERGTERAMIADFGIARLAHASSETAAGELLGTPEFMSPEQVAGAAIDGRSDLYSLGAVAFYALSGQLPFTAATAQGVLAQHLTKPAPAINSVARAVPRSLAQAIDRCLRKEPAERFSNGEELAAALAQGLEKRSEVPVPVRVFLDRRRLVVVIVPIAMGLPMTLGLIANMARHGGSSLSIVGAVAGMTALALGIPFAVIVNRVRRLVKFGFGPDDLAAALRASYERRREEFHFEYGAVLSKREKTLRAVAGAGMLLGAGSIVGILAHGPLDSLVPLSFLGFYVGTLTSVLSLKWRRLRKGTGSVWAAFWNGNKGRALARLAGFGLGPRAAAGNRPTEMAIAMSAEALYAPLPKALRASLGDVPAVLRALEAQARQARARMEELDGAINEAMRGPGGRGAVEQQDALVADLREARGNAEARLSELVTALETLRLDLLRLSAGAGSVDGITSDLAAAREFGEQADRFLESSKEVDRALKSRTPRPGGSPAGTS